jgi:hypothetical protein
MLNIEIKIQLHNIKKNITLQFSKQLMKYDIKKKTSTKIEKKIIIYSHINY